MSATTKGEQNMSKITSHMSEYERQYSWADLRDVPVREAIDCGQRIVALMSDKFTCKSFGERVYVYGFSHQHENYMTVECNFTSEEDKADSLVELYDKLRGTGKDYARVIFNGDELNSTVTFVW